MRKKAERRKNKRIRCSVPVECKSGTDFDTSQSVDISKGGIGFVSKKSISIDKKVAVEIDLIPDDKPVLIMGKVKWVSMDPDVGQYRIGMQFGSILLSGSRARLNRYFNE